MEGSDKYVNKGVADNGLQCRHKLIAEVGGRKLVDRGKTYMKDLTEQNLSCLG